jgi:elongation factor G
VIDQIEEKFTIRTLLLQIPLGIEENFSGVIDLIAMKAYRYSDEASDDNFEIIPVPAEYREEAEVNRENLIERLSDIDLELMESFLEKKPISEEMIKKAVRNACLALTGVPVVLGSAFKRKGIQNLLDTIVDCLPSPADKGDIEGISPRTGDKIIRKLSDSEPFSALIFKIMSDPYVGQLIYFRVYSGFLKSGDTVYNPNKGKKYRVLKLLKMHANKREEVDKVHSGDIAVTVGLNDVSTGDTLCDERNQVVFEAIQFPDPVISATIEPRLTSDHNKLDQVLAKLSVEDPTFRAQVNPETGQKIISGMGELHLEVVRERMKREFNIQTRMGKPRVAYHETIRRVSTGESKYCKQTGGRNHYAHVVLSVAPLDHGGKFRFNTNIGHRLIPQEFFPAVEAGVRESLDTGVVAGYPIINVAVTLVDGSAHETDSSEMAFKIAASQAFQEAFKQGDPVLLEPLMKVEIVVQDEYLGDVIGDFNAREGKVTHMDVKNSLHIVDGLAPLSNMFGYATAFRTLTQGRASYSMEFYDNVEMTDKKMYDVLRNQLGIYTFN